MKEDPGIAEQKQREIEIRRAEADDIDGLLTIERQCFNVYYYAFYTFDRRDFEFYLEDPDSLFLAALFGDRLVGYVLGPVERWRTPPGAHIDSIAVLPEMQHEGIGSRLLQAYMEQAARHGGEVVTLEVSPANEAGMAFFTKHGFRKVHRLRNYYGRGLHGVLLTAPCAPSPSSSGR